MCTLQSLLEKFSWLEVEKVPLIKARNEKASNFVSEQPMFCFETAIKLFYWSNVVYAYKEVWMAFWQAHLYAEGAS